MFKDQIDVLLVEDNKSDAKLTIRTLEKYNMANNLVHVIDGAQALDFIFARGEFEGRNMANKPKLILLDIKMPKVSGLEVLDILKSDERTKSIPVVMITSSKEEKDIVDSHKLGVNSYVVKPVVFADFSKTIGDLASYWLVINNTPH